MNLYDQRELMRRNNLEMTVKLDKIIEGAKPKPIIEKRPIIPKRIIIDQDITGTPEYKATQQLSDLLLTQNLNNIITGAMNSISGKTSERDTKVSQEVQDDFRAMNPVEVGDQKRLYYDIPIPALPNPIPIPYHGARTSEAEFVAEKERLLLKLNTSYGERDAKQAEIQAVEDDINNKVYDDPAGFVSTIPVYDPMARALELEAKTIITNPKTGVDFESNEPLIRIRNEINARDKSFKTRATGIKFLINAIVKYEEDQYNQAVIDEEAVFRGKPGIGKTEANLQDDLIALRAELVVIEAQILATETEISALDVEYKDFLQNIEENYVETNKTENQRRLLANDALNTFNRLNQGRVQIQREPQETDKQLLDRIAQLGTIQADPSDVKNQIFDKAKKNVLTLTPDMTKTELVLKNLSSEQQHLMNKIFPKIKKNYFETFGSNNKDVTENDISDFIKSEINSHGFKPILATGDEVLAPEELALTAIGSGIGSGIAHKVLPSSFVFGKIKIDLNKLFYRNILSIKDLKGKQINGQMNKHVSDNFVDIIFKILENKNVTKTDLKNIHSERILYDNLIVQSGMHKSRQILTTIEDTAPEMKNRLGLLTGEIEAGNSNVALLKELHELVFKMAQINLISRSAATSYYNNIKKNYFSHIN